MRLRIFCAPLLPAFLALLPAAISTGGCTGSPPSGTPISRQVPRLVADWPCWSGPKTTFEASDFDSELVDDLNNARLAWRSEAITPMGKAHAARSSSFSAGRHGGNQKAKPAGGGASPVVSEGRLFLSYYVPGGDPPVLVKPDGRVPEEDVGSRHVSADEVVLCIDASNGKTIWKQVYKDQGVNLQEGKSPGYSGLTPCVDNGRVYTASTMMRIYCHDTESGKLLWRTSTPGVTDKTEERKQKGLKEKTRASCHVLAKQGGKNLIFAGGVLLIPVGRDLMGVDGKTGDVLWTAKNVLGNTATPTRWSHEGIDYVLAGNDDGLIRLIEPKSGKALWMIKDAGPNGVNVMVINDLLVARAGSFEVPREGRNKPDVLGLLGAWRITPEKADPVWKHTNRDHAVHKWGVVIPGPDRLYIQSPGLTLTCFETATGRFLADAKVPVGRLPGTTVRIGNRLIVETDGSHMSMNLHLVQLLPEGARQLGEPWINPNPPTTSYVPALCHPFVDGRLYVRGADGIYCYDLRKQ